MTFDRRTIEGQEVEFRKLTRRDIHALAVKIREMKRQEAQLHLAALLKAGVTQDQLPLIVMDLTRDPSEPEIIRWIHTPTGITAVLSVISGVSESVIETGAEAES